MGPTRESVKKLDQIIQNFHSKAAVLILQSRMHTTPAGDRKQSKWFQIETNDVDEFRDDFKIWRQAGSFDNRPPPMIIETYIDASRLSNGQSLVILDENGKRWDALEVLNSSESSSAEGSPPRLRERNTEIVLERWRIELRCLPTDEPGEFGPSLPTIYKRSIVFFRSLFTITRVMPCWKLAQQSMAKTGHPALQVKCRFRTAEPDYLSYDPLRLPLFDGRDVVTEYMFGDLEVPVGRLYASVSYRNDCSFRVDDSESLLSSRFTGVDENFFRPTMAINRPRPEAQRPEPVAEPGSLPSHRQGRGAQEPQQTYGSLSTFHGAGALGTSPITALRAMRPAGSDTDSPPASAPASVEADSPHSLPIRSLSTTTRPSPRHAEAASRRQSISFQPFKAGSLTASPRLPPEADVPASPSSCARPSGISGITQARNRSSLTAGMAASLRGGPPQQSVPPPAPTPSPLPAVEAPPIVGSPKPGSRYGSSFSHRRARTSFGGQSRAVDDDQGSSGKQSLSSSAQPGSGLLAEAGAGGSSGSLQNDDDNISDFLKALDSRKTLQSFDTTKKGESFAAKRTAAQLSKFHLMKDSNNALTESMTSSMHLHRSSSSSSRQLQNVPAMVNPASMSTCSSPGKPLSPHTPHTPAIPSRLSENSIIDYHAQAPGQTRLRQGARNPDIGEEMTDDDEDGDDDDDDDDDEGAPVSQEGTRAIEIPLSPRVLQHGTFSSARRSSSVAQREQPRRAARRDQDAMADADMLPGQRSISLGAGERGEAPTLSTLLGRQAAAGVGAGGQGAGAGVLQPPAEIRAAAAAAAALGKPSLSPGAHARGGSGDSPGQLFPSASGHRGTLRYNQGGALGSDSGSRPSPQPSSRESFSGGRYAASQARGGLGVVGGVGGEEGDTDEPLVFAMSELERDSRRSLDEARALGVVGLGGRRGGGRGGGEGSGSASDSRDKGGFEPRGVTKRGW